MGLAGPVQIVDVAATTDEQAPVFFTSDPRAKTHGAFRRTSRTPDEMRIALLVLAGGAFAWWRDHGRTRNADAVATLLDQCEDDLRADRALPAAIAFAAAERRAADGGAEASAGRLTRCRTELALLRELDDRGRVPGVTVGTVDETLEFLRELERSNRGK